jgi:hypothetical protein
MLDESTLLIADSGSHKIRQLDVRTGMTKLFCWCFTIAEFDPKTVIFHLTIHSTYAGEVTTLAGDGREHYADGLAAQSQFRFPMGVCIDPQKHVLIADQKNFCIRMLADGNSLPCKLQIAVCSFLFYSNVASSIVFISNSGLYLGT